MIISFDKEIVRKNIKYLRKLKNLTQKEFAEKLSVPPSYVSKVETGRCVPSVTFVKCTADLFNIIIDDILFYDLSDETSYKHLVLQICMLSKEKQKAVEQEIKKMIENNIPPFNKDK